MTLAKFDFCADEDDGLTLRVVGQGELGQFGVRAGLKVVGQKHLGSSSSGGALPRS